MKQRKFLANNKVAASATADAPQNEPEEKKSRMSPWTRALLLLIGSVCIFACTVVMCFALMNRSAEADPLPVQEPKELKYEVNLQPPASEDIPPELEAPESIYGSNRLNILLIGLDTATNRTDTLVLFSVDIATKESAMLSIPRDTYISGNFDEPRLNQVYKESESGERGIRAVKEMVKDMIGYWPDYYFVLDDATMSGIVDLCGKIDFDVPEEPSYCDLSAGYQSLSASKAMKLLTFRSDYTEISTEPARIQRSFLQTLLTELLQDEEMIEYNSRAIAGFADTDLSADDLAYLGHLLQGTDMKSIYSRALPGEVIEAGGKSYYQVDAEEAVNILNEIFNPLDDDLTVYDVNFRQLTGGSGEGSYSDFGFGNGQNNTDDSTGNTTDSTADTSENTDVTETTEADMPAETDPPAESDPPAPTDSETTP